MTAKLVLHPCANLFPEMSETEFEALKADIAANGLREPIWTSRGKLIDGRHRSRACRELGIEPAVREWDGVGSLVGFVVSLNLRRRHLDQSQRAAVAVDIEPLLAVEAKERAEAGRKKGGKTAGRGRPKADSSPEKVPGSNPQGEAREQAAKLTGTNGRYVGDAKKLRAKSPELFAKVKAGTLKLPRAMQQVRRDEKRREMEAQSRAAPALTGDSCRVVTGDVLEELPRLTDRPRLIFADPPYNIGVDYGDGEKADRLPDEEYMAWVTAWVQLSRLALADDGSFWVLIGDEYAGEYAVLLKRHFTVRSWIKWYETFGVNCSDKFNRTSRHLFYCTVSPRQFVFHREPVTRPSDRQAKYNDSRADPAGKIWDDVWQIPRLVGTAAERIPDFPTQLPLALLCPIIACASDAGDLILDPFSGSATTGAAALVLGRRYVGIERSERFAELSRARLRTLTPKE